jgi:hypothetical protein
MKKLFVLPALLLFFAANAFAELNVKISLDVLGDIKGDMAEDVKAGYTVSGEFIYPIIGEDLGIGAGVEYLYSRPIDKGVNPEFTLMPIYFTAKLKIPIIDIYAKVNYGFNTIVESDIHDMKGQSYISGAIGWEILLGLFTELSYGRYYFDADKLSCSYNKIGLNIGYSFKSI